MSFLRPSADVSDGNWTTDLDGTDLAGAIDETTASDTDYIRSGVNPSGDVCRLAISDPTGSVDTASAVTVRYRYAKSGSAQVNITARLKEGATTIASWLHEDVAASWVTAAQTLSGPEKASVADWSALEIEFEASGVVDQLGGGTITADASLTGGAIGQVHGIGGAAIVAGAALSGGDVGQSHKIAGATIASASALSGGGIGQDHKLAGATLTAASSMSGGGIAESGGGPTYTPVLTDDCDQSNSTVTSGSPLYWNQLQTAGGVRYTGSGEIESGGTSYAAVVADSAYTFNADQYIQFEINSFGTDWRPLARVGSTANYLHATITASGAELFKRVGGTSTSLGTVTETWTLGSTFRLDVIGNDMTLYVNDVEKVSGSTGGDLSGANPVGFAAYQGNDTTIDNIVAGNIT